MAQKNLSSGVDIGGNIAHTLPLFDADLKNDLKKACVALKIAPSRLFENAALMGRARLLDDEFWKKGRHSCRIFNTRFCWSNFVRPV